MLTYAHVEDYLEYLAGYEVGLSSLINPPLTGRISLARYDIQIVDSMANTVMFGSALTDRQGDLAVKLILKYRRQFAKCGIDVTPIENPQFRIPLRKINRDKRIWIDDDVIRIQFAYDPERIKDLRYIASQSQGKLWWNAQTKLWSAGLTEYNINYLVPWCEKHGFDIDPKVQELFDRILACEKIPYEIKLVKTDQGYTITNAAQSLLEYIDQHIGDDLVKLIDYAGVLGYTVDADILEQSSEQYGQALEYIGTKHNVYLDPTPEMLEWLFDYAALTNRYPICVWDPNLVNELDLSRFEEQDIVRFDQNGKTSTSEYDPYGVKVIYARKIPKSWDFPIPLLVSTQQMMYGGRKLDWINRAEKVVYFCHAKLREEN